MGLLNVNIGRNGAAFDPGTNTLYMTNDFKDSLYTINTITGVSTHVGSLGFGFGGVDGLAFAGQAAVPEPTTITLLGIGLAGLAGVEVRRRRKRNAVDKT